MRWGLVTLPVQYSVIALTVILTKILIQFAHPLVAFCFRYLLSGVVLFIACLFVKTKKVALFWIHPWYVWIGAALRMFLPSVGVYWAAQYVSVAKIVLFGAFTPFITYLLSYLFLDEKTTYKKFIALSIGFCGMIPIITTKFVGQNLSLADLFVISLPEIVILLSYVSMCVGDLYMKKFTSVEPQASSYAIAAHDSFFGAVFALPFIFLPSFHVNHTIVNLPSFFKWCMLAALLNFVGRPLYAWHFKYYSNTFLYLVGLSTPFLAAFFGWILLGETVGLDFYISALFAVTGSVLFYLEERKIAVMHFAELDLRNGKKI